MEGTSIDFVDIALRLALSLAVVVVALIAYRMIRNETKRKIEEPTRRQAMHATLRNVFAIAGFVIIVLIWLPTGNNLAIALGILGAGLAIASQEMIGSLAAGLNIWIGSIYRIGDRVRVGDVVGDVMDISLLRTTVMEVGDSVIGSRPTSTRGALSPSPTGRCGPIQCTTIPSTGGISGTRSLSPLPTRVTGSVQPNSFWSMGRRTPKNCRPTQKPS
jgi:hypothetical protein